MPRSSARQAWADAFRPACRARGMRFVSEEGFLLDDVYLTSISTQVFHEGSEALRITWDVSIKPLAIDEVLWAAFLPDVEMGPKMRINRRINGAFTIQPLRLSRASHDVAATDEPDWEPVLDEFDRVRADFIADHPTAADFVSALRRADDGIAPSRGLTRLVTALISAGDNTEAANIADEAIARGERGSMSSTVDVLKYLSAYAKGPEAYSAFTASLAPTHDYQVLQHSDRDISVGLSREHHRGTMRRDLESMNGADPWAVVLRARAPLGAPEDFTTSRYLQAAGTAEAMVVELCMPGGADIGAVSVRSVVGHPSTGRAERDVEITLPRGIERISRDEVFTADQAAGLFETFYRTDTIGEDYVLRPVEGYTADGGHVYPET
ncbi:hypothetical protein H7J87_08515 [Mycolicibacterium wolinskyi]|nr:MULTISPECIES: hypothetical protein [Mycolicibacterium]MCV7285368.1 hypothetical protein [Mycolicibacterium wolinskyi]MCV7295129.1 hypothetical protein [Mycolicibacterium goodii]